MSRMTMALVALGAMFLALMLVVSGNDRGSATEVALLNGSASQCDAMYHAIWKVQDEPSHSTLVDIANGLDCPFGE